MEKSGKEKEIFQRGREKEKRKKKKIDSRQWRSVLDIYGDGLGFEEVEEKKKKEGKNNKEERN